MRNASVLIFCLYIPLFAAVAGKEQYLPVLRYLGEIVERIAHARIVKVDERVIKHDRAGILSAEEHIAQREPQRQIQLIGCTPAEEGALMEHRFPGAADKRIQLAVERELRIRSAGQPGEHRRGAFCQRRGKLRAHLLIGKRQLVERGGQCLQLEFHTFVFRFQLTQAGFPDQRIAKRIEPSAQAGRLLTEKLLLLFVFRHLAERRGVAAEDRCEFLMEPQLLFGKAPGVFALFLRRTGESVGLFPLRVILVEPFRNILRRFGAVPVQYLKEHPVGIGTVTRTERRYDPHRRECEKRRGSTDPEHAAEKARGSEAAGKKHKQYPYPPSYAG